MRLHEPNEVADLRAKLEEVEANAREQRDALLHFGRDWQRRAEAAETALREIERALRSQDWSIERLEHQRRTALTIAQTALKRARTTTTEEVPHA